MQTTSPITGQPITRRAFLAAALAVVAAAASPTTAQAIPRHLRDCPRIAQNGITYLLYQRAAIVTHCPARRSVTIPHSIRHAGRTYTVTAIWDGAISSQMRRLVIKARDLETIEDAAIWDRRTLTVIVHDMSTYAWIVSAKHSSKVIYRG